MAPYREVGRAEQGRSTGNHPEQPHNYKINSTESDHRDNQQRTSWDWDWDQDLPRSRSQAFLVLMIGSGPVFLVTDSVLVSVPVLWIGY